MSVVATAHGRVGGRTTTTSSPAILVVDDNPAKRIAIESVLEPLGHRIVEVSSGEAALHAVMGETFAAILMDVQMPSMDGYETAKLIRLRHECEHTPIIFVTSYARAETQVPLGYASGAVDFIFAPIVPDILRAKVSFFVELFVKSCELERIGNEFRDNEARIRAVLENVADGIVTIGANGMVESFNRAAVSLFGYTELEAIGKPVSMMISPKSSTGFDDHEQATQQILLEGKRGRSGEWVGLRKDGSRLPIELDLSDVQLGARKIHIGCLRRVRHPLASDEQ